LDVLAALRAGGARDDDAEPALAAGTDHLDVSAQHAWAVSCACVDTGLDDAAALLERFRGALLSSFGGRKAAARLFGSNAVSLLGTTARPLHVHLVAGAGPAVFSMAPHRVLVVRSVEAAEQLMCALLLCGGRAACCATAAPALPLALRDKLVQDGHVGTARPVLTNAPGLAPANPATFTTATFVARGEEAERMPRRAMWAEFLQHALDKHGAHALLAFARCDAALAPGGGAPGAGAHALAAALDAAAAACFSNVDSFTHMLQGACVRTSRHSCHASGACAPLSPARLTALHCTPNAQTGRTAHGSWWRTSRPTRGRAAWALAWALTRRWSRRRRLLRKRRRRSARWTTTASWLWPCLCWTAGAGWSSGCGARSGATCTGASPR
jgi:hypothetical protein